MPGFGKLELRDYARFIAGDPGFFREFKREGRSEVGPELTHAYIDALESHLVCEHGFKNLGEFIRFSLSVDPNSVNEDHVQRLFRFTFDESPRIRELWLSNFEDSMKAILEKKPDLAKALKRQDMDNIVKALLDCNKPKELFSSIARGIQKLREHNTSLKVSLSRLLDHPMENPHKLEFLGHALAQAISDYPDILDVDDDAVRKILDIAPLLDRDTRRDIIMNLEYMDVDVAREMTKTLVESKDLEPRHILKLDKLIRDVHPSKRLDLFLELRRLEKGKMQELLDMGSQVSEEP